MPTLYIDGKNREARLGDRRVSIEQFMEDGTVVRAMVPIHAIDRVVLIGRPRMTFPLLHQLIRQEIPIVFLSSRGRWLATLDSAVHGNALRRIRQYQASQDASLSCQIAHALVVAKIRNMRRHLQRLAASRGQSQSKVQQDAMSQLKSLQTRVENVDALDEIRGYEGAATACYFQRIGAFFPPQIPFCGRSRRPPRDSANALLSWTYSIVAAEVESAIRLAGLDPAIGFLHELDYGRPSLVYDLIEPLRAPFCDALVLHLLNHNLLNEKHFSQNDDDCGVCLLPDAHKIFFSEYERYLERRFTLPKSGQSTTFREVISHMCQVICHVLAGDTREPEFFLAP